jgi:imidazolonepropionase-like amidohydrolase
VCGGLAHRKGRIALGFDAGILAVDGDPIADPDALHCIRAVYAGGPARQRRAGGGDMTPGPAIL